MKKIFILTAMLLSLAEAGFIEVSQKQQNDLGVKLQKTTAIESMKIGPFNAKVTIEQKDIISIGSNVDSVVEDIYVKNYQHVKRGQKLLSISSHEFLNMQEEYIKALIDWENIEKSYKRDEKLFQKGVVPEKKFLETLREKQNLESRVKLGTNKLLSSGFDKVMLDRIKKTHESIIRLNLLAPKDSIVDTIDVNIGQKVESNQNMMKIYADSDRFIEINVPVKSLKNISIGDRCEFDEYTAKISSIGFIVNPDSQSVKVRAKIDKSKNIMLNRIYQVDVKKNIEGALKIKKTALVFEDNKAYVFKKVDGGFESIDVEVIKEGPVCYVVDSKLKAGDSLAVSSTSALLSAMDSGDE